MSDIISTPHIKAKKSDFGKTVLMPGDPLRSKFIAENFLKNAVLINNVRGIQGYTGEYQGVKISVMASGMGMPSMGIYSYELFKDFGVENIIRIGSAGSMNLNVKVRDIVIGQGACTNSNFANQYHLPGTFAPICDFNLLKSVVEEAEKLSLNYHVGNMLSSDTFYNDIQEDSLVWSKMGVMAVEMESAALYMNAARLGKRAITICTISDSLITGESLSSDLRQTSFTDMMTLALNVAKKL